MPLDHWTEGRVKAEAMTEQNFRNFLSRHRAVHSKY